MKALRIAGRIALGSLGIVLILFPDVPKLCSQLGRIGAAESLIESAHPAVAEMSRAVDREMPPGLTRAEQVVWIEKFVGRSLPYCHDWTQWWNADYWPTASEAIAAGREDCDGIAVVAASVLRHRGFRARLVGNTMHIWVAVDDTGQEILGAQEDKAFASDLGWSLPRFSTLVEGMRFGLVEFPWSRWGLLLAWGLGVISWGSRRRVLRSVAAGLVALGLAVAAAHLVHGAAFGVSIAALLLGLIGFEIWTFRVARAAGH